MDKQTFIQKAWELQARYRCSDAVRAHLAQLDFIATAGATGVGKTTIMESCEIPYVLSDVTRSPRKQEKNGVDYNFRTDYDKLWEELQNGEFVQYLVSQTEEFYGTKDSSYPDSGYCTMGVFANAVDFFKSLGFRSVTPIYILPPNFEEWTRRAQANYGDETKKRWIEAKESLEIALSDTSYNFLVNDNLAQTIKDFRSMAFGQAKDPEYQKHAREVAIQLLTKIEID